MKNIDIIKEAYNRTIPVSIRLNDRNTNNLQVVSYTDDMVTFLKNRKKIEMPISNVDFNVDYSEDFYRDLYCKEKVDMTWEQLQSYIERAYNCNDCDYDQIGNKYSASSAKRIYITVNDLDLIAAMTYGTVTGVRFPGGVIVNQHYSVTSSQWERRIL